MGTHGCVYESLWLLFIRGDELEEVTEDVAQVHLGSGDSMENGMLVYSEEFKSAARMK